jgi:exopolyphosphatase/guanosine-5'-triphosphate,3'-diphosphate pyrophosphatase
MIREEIIVNELPRGSGVSHRAMVSNAGAICVSVTSDSVETGKSSVAAAFDIGTNTIKMTVARRTESWEVEEFHWRSETVRLGLDIDTTGQLAPDRIAAAFDTLERFCAEARSLGAARLVGVATEASRVASNGPAFLDEVRARTGIEIQVISGPEEARLTFLGLDGVVDLSGKVVVADIGGGSTELILAVDRAISWSHSFPIGSGRFTDRYVTDDPPNIAEVSRCREAARREIAGVDFSGVAHGRLIVVGGTGEYLDQLLPADVPRTATGLETALQLLQSIPSLELATKLTIPEARARVLPAGIAIAAGICDAVQPRDFTAAMSGIRRGLLLSTFAEMA